MYHPFSVAETFKVAWHILKKNIATVSVYSILSLLIISIFGFAIYYFLTDNYVLQTIGVIILLIGISFVFLGFIKLIIILLDKEYYEFGFRDIVPTIKMLYSYVLLLIIVSTISVFMTNGIQMLSDNLVQNLLGIGVKMFFQFFFLFYFPICTCFIVDDGSGPFESVAQSFQLIKGNFLKYFLLFLLIELMVYVGYKTYVGMVFVIPFVNIILVVAYRKLVYSHLDVEDDIAETI